MQTCRPRPPPSRDLGRGWPRGLDLDLEMAKSQLLVRADGMNEWSGIQLRSLTVHLALPRAKEAPLGWDRWARGLGKQSGAHSPARI